MYKLAPIYYLCLSIRLTYTWTAKAWVVFASCYNWGSCPLYYTYIYRKLFLSTCTCFSNARVDADDRVGGPPGDRAPHQVVRSRGPLPGRRLYRERPACWWIELLVRHHFSEYFYTLKLYAYGLFHQNNLDIATHSSFQHFICNV